MLAAHNEDLKNPAKSLPKCCPENKNSSCLFDTSHTLQRIRRHRIQHILQIGVGHVQPTIFIKMRIPNIDDFDITDLSYREERRLVRRSPDSTLYIVPNSENASTLQQIERYDSRRMTFLQVLSLDIRCRNGKRRYLVPRERFNDDTLPSYSSVMESNGARSTVGVRQTSQCGRISSPSRSLEACRSSVRRHSSNLHEETSELPNPRFDTFDMNLKDLVDTFVSRTSLVRLFFTGARGSSTPAIPGLAEHLERLAVSLDKLRPEFERVTTGECISSRWELLDYGESLFASLKRWIDKAKPMFDDFRVVMFGDEQGHLVQVTDGDYEAWAREAREMGNWTQILINRVEALRTILQESLPPLQITSVLVDSETDSLEERAVGRASKGGLRETARIARLKREEKENHQQLDGRAAHRSTATTFCWIPGVSCY